MPSSMLVLTPNGRLGYVTSQGDGVSQVLLFEAYAIHEFRTSELRSLTAPAD